MTRPFAGLPIHGRGEASGLYPVGYDAIVLAREPEVFWAAAAAAAAPARRLNRSAAPVSC